MSLNTRRLGMLFGVVAALAAPSAEAQGTGTLEGRVLDNLSGDPLPGAAVSVLGTSKQVSSDRTGRFRIGGVPAGSQTLVVSYLGRSEARVPVTVGAGPTTSQEVRLAPLSYTETVTVSAEIVSDAQARALNATPPAGPGAGLRASTWRTSAATEGSILKSARAAQP